MNEFSDVAGETDVSVVNAQSSKMKYACKKHGMNHDNCSEKTKKEDDEDSVDFMTCYNNNGDGFDTGSMRMGDITSPSLIIDS